MASLLDQLWLGLTVSMTLQNILLCTLGVSLGMVVGVLPGLGPAATLSLLLPVTFHLDLAGALVMLSGVYYGAMYGGSITAILVRIPGEAASIVTCIDGYAMAKRGRAGAALGLSAIGSFIAGIAATIGIVFLGPTVAKYALKFTAVEYVGLVLTGLALATLVTQMPPMRSILMVALGLLLATVGLDPIWGDGRYVFDNIALYDGLNIAVLAMGLFGVAEVLIVAERSRKSSPHLEIDYSISNLLPNRKEWSSGGPAVARGSILGFFLGVLPGGGTALASFGSYILERKISRTPQEFGHGAPAGVAGPESANNAASQSSFIPLLCLGIPSNLVMAIMMGALLIQGVTPGPRLLTEHPDLFWGVIISMFIGNIILIFMNLPLISLFVRLLKVPFSIMSPAIILFCMIGAYSLRSNVVDVVMLVVAGAAGYIFRKLRLDPAPLVLSFVLGDILEKSFRQALIIGRGHLTIFIERPLAAFFIALAALLLLVQIKNAFTKPKTTELPMAN
ncbi:putative tricarboxylic transport membrane protein [Neorhizobium galegae]|uniref:tripartite tricarboxylate transporter permease n=1 Tax=Neorhizobium galegae TaxID=399 RepID=UPI00277E9280|nr:tripartite tricarboxylate transporter permease [Neorhizobium galegae]MDQ0137746.1 putative tricarboxylic transport membrane protein [Neorhizobium galegae]